MRGRHALMQTFVMIGTMQLESKYMSEQERQRGTRLQYDGIVQGLGLLILLALCNGTP